jgi:hypothetical protein
MLTFYRLLATTLLPLGLIFFNPMLGLFAILVFLFLHTFSYLMTFKKMRTMNFWIFNLLIY